jgi:hypothetical protein
MMNDNSISDIVVQTAPSYVTRKLVRDLYRVADENGLGVQRHLVDYGSSNRSIRSIYNLTMPATVPLMQIGGLKLGKMQGKSPIAYVHVVQEPNYIIDVLVEGQMDVITKLAGELQRIGYNITVRKI